MTCDVSELLLPDTWHFCTPGALCPTLQLSRDPASTVARKLHGLIKERLSLTVDAMQPGMSHPSLIDVAVRRLAEVREHSGCALIGHAMRGAVSHAVYALMYRC